MVLRVRSVLAALVACCACVIAEHCQHEPRARTDAGWVCGACDPRGSFAQFLAVPYAKQPVGALRFQALHKPDPWKGCRNVAEGGPVCPQRDVFYGPIMRGGNSPRSMSEECIHANVYAPLKHLPQEGRNASLLPVLVYVHGGGFDFGSGDPDAHGPEYLMKENVVVITFNYRVGVFGFLSLNSSCIPGNAGLRDMLTLLRWVQRNAEAFGGDPKDVTLAGQSAGAAATHLLTLSKPAQGLFKRAILMSGTASRNFFTTSPANAQLMSQMFLKYVDINSTDPDEVHRLLIDLPLHKIMEAHNKLQDFTGLVVFTPVVESEHCGVERILDDDPEILQARGRGKDIPLIIGFTNVECETFRPRFEAIDIAKRVNELPLLMVPPGVIYATLPDQLPNKIAMMQQTYFKETVDVDTFLRYCSDSSFIYPALKLAERRAASGGAPAFLYRFAYNADYSVYKEALDLKYHGAGHSEDLTFVFRANHVLRNSTLSEADKAMMKTMTSYVSNFMRYSKPSNSWLPVKKEKLVYKNIPEDESLRSYHRMMKFFDSVYGAAS